MYFIIVIVWLYSILLLFFTKLWNDIPLEEVPDALANNHSCSVLIPFRNEAHNLPSLIASLSKVDFPTDQIEFIFIDDHSNDSSLKIIKSELKSFPFKYDVLELPEEITGKKNAQLSGVEKSKFELIICTDADCEVPINWVKGMQQTFSNASTHMVTGNITFSGRNLWSSLMRVEFAPLIGITGVGISLNRPIMANGANMAFRKSSFLKVLNNRNDMIKVASGDDIFLLGAIKKQFGSDSFGFCKTTHVVTKPPASLNSFFQQRIRWASKWKGHGSLLSSLPAALVWLFHLMLTLSIVYLIIESGWIMLSCLLIPKGICEYMFIKSIFKSYPLRLNVFLFILVSIFYSIYVILFGLSANFVKYKWKDRAYG